MRVAATSFCCVALAICNSASAGIIFDILEVSGNVEITVSGAMNLNATQGFHGDSFNANNILGPTDGVILMGTGSGDTYNVDVASWTSFGTGTNTALDSTSASRIALFGGPFLGLPDGYVSGASLSVTATEFGATFMSMGLDPGSYVTTLTNGSITDTVTVNVGPQSGAAIPEPGSMFIMILACVAVVYKTRHNGLHSVVR